MASARIAHDYRVGSLPTYKSRSTISCSRFTVFQIRTVWQLLVVKHCLILKKLQTQFPTRNQTMKRINL
jgi:hypothetical protein